MDKKNNERIITELREAGKRLCLVAEQIEIWTQNGREISAHEMKLFGLDLGTVKGRVNVADYLLTFETAKAELKEELNNGTV